YGADNNARGVADGGAVHVDQHLAAVERATAHVYSGWADQHFTAQHAIHCVVFGRHRITRSVAHVEQDAAFLWRADIVVGVGVESKEPAHGGVRANDARGCIVDYHRVSDGL